MGLFREQALAKLRSPEQLDEFVRVVPPRTWIAAAVVAAVLAAALAWSILDEVPTHETANGALVAPGAIRAVAAPRAGLVSSVAVAIGERVEKGEALLRISHSAGSRAVRVSISGTVSAVDVAAGDSVARGDQLVSIVRRSASNELSAVAYLPPGEAAELAKGMSVTVTAAGTPTDVYGYLRGEVSAVATLPVTAATVQATVGDKALVDELIANTDGAPTRVVISLHRAATPSGYAWTRGSGPSYRLADGTLAELEVTTGSQQPIDFLLPG